MIFKKKNIKTTTYEIDLSQPKLTCKINDLNQKTMITHKKNK